MLYVGSNSVGNYIFTPEEAEPYVAKYWKLAEEGLKIPIYKDYPFTEDGVRQSQIDLKGRVTTGKLLINIGGSSE